MTEYQATSTLLDGYPMQSCQVVQGRPGSAGDCVLDEGILKVVSECDSRAGELLLIHVPPGFRQQVQFPFQCLGRVCQQVIGLLR